jgi:hypothetical protein
MGITKNVAKRRIGDDDPKEMITPLDVPQLSESQQKLVQAQVKRMSTTHSFHFFPLTLWPVHERAEIAIDAATLKIMRPVYEARRAVVKSLPRFWGTALAQHDQLAVYMAGQDDMRALAHITDLWVEYDSIESRAFTIVFVSAYSLAHGRAKYNTVTQEFSENPYFSDKLLKKEYKYTPPTGAPAPGTGVDANGVSDAQEAFEWESHITPQVSVSCASNSNLWCTQPSLPSKDYQNQLERRCT